MIGSRAAIHHVNEFESQLSLNGGAEIGTI